MTTTTTAVAADAGPSSKHSLGFPAGIHHLSAYRFLIDVTWDVRRVSCTLLAAVGLTRSSSPSSSSSSSSVCRSLMSQLNAHQSLNGKIEHDPCCFVFCVVSCVCSCIQAGTMYLFFFFKSYHMRIYVETHAHLSVADTKTLSETAPEEIARQ